MKSKGGRGGGQNTRVERQVLFFRRAKHFSCLFSFACPLSPLCPLHAARRGTRRPSGARGGGECGESGGGRERPRGDGAWRKKGPPRGWAWSPPSTTLPPHSLTHAHSSHTQAATGSSGTAAVRSAGELFLCDLRGRAKSGVRSLAPVPGLGPPACHPPFAWQEEPHFLQRRVGKRDGRGARVDHMRKWVPTLCLPLPSPTVASTSTVSPLASR